MRRYEVRYQNKAGEFVRVAVRAADAAGALGVVLDDVEDIHRASAFEVVLVAAAVPRPERRRPRKPSLDDVGRFVGGHRSGQPTDEEPGPLPDGLNEAYNKALKEAK